MYDMYPWDTRSAADTAKPEPAIKAVQIALHDGIAQIGQRVVITAGVPFGTPGNTNVLRIAFIEEQSDPRQLKLVG